MNPTVAKLLQFAVDLLLPLAVGYFALRRLPGHQRVADVLLRLGMLGCAPLLALVSVWKMQLTWELLWLPVLGVLMQVLPGAVGFYRVKRKFADPLEQGAYVVSVMLSNRGVVGAITIAVLFGEQGYAWANLIMLLAPVVVYSFCFPLAQHYHQRSHGDAGRRKPWWSLVLTVNQAPTLGLLIGALLNVTHTARPAWGDAAFVPLVHAFAWLCVLPIGMTLDGGQVRRYLPHTVDQLWLKFLFTPLLVGALAYAVGLRGGVLATTVILACSPTAINAVIVARFNRINADFAMASVLVTTMVYLVLLPALLLWGKWMVG